VIATGSRPAIPRIHGLPETPHHTNETIFSLTERPARLLVLGAGAIGCELAQATGQRWCNNGLALKFVPKGEPLPALRT
jgi:pyruvate/2-oxoglutarate dehydrogenase complex dihydrolipoamide dehydrogenase (E3) component